MLVWLITGASILLLVAAFAVHRANQPVNRFTRKRRREADEPVHEPVDEIDAYWGNAMPDVDMRSDPEVRPALTSPAKTASTPSSSAAQSDRRSTSPPARKRSIRRLQDATPAEQSVGERACQLGSALLKETADQRQMLPGTRGRATPEDIAHAQRALRRASPTRTFAHGAIVQRIGDDTYLYVDPLESSAGGSLSFVSTLQSLVGAAHFLVLLGRGDDEGTVHDEHVGAILETFSVAPEHLLLLQEDGGFHNHLEERRHYVPARLDVARIPDSFVEGMLDYAQDRFDASDPEAVLRTVGPIAGPLWNRVHHHGDFDPGVLAQALNLLGAANRSVFCFEEAVACFESALQILKRIEAYDAMPIVQANLGQALTALARQRGNDPDALRLATRHLQSAVRLDDEDLDTQRALANVYLLRYQVEGSRSLLSRAAHVLRQVVDLDGTDDDEALLVELEHMQHNRLGSSSGIPRSSIADDPGQPGYVPVPTDENRTPESESR